MQTKSRKISSNDIDYKISVIVDGPRVDIPSRDELEGSEFDPMQCTHYLYHRSEPQQKYWQRAFY